VKPEVWSWEGYWTATCQFDESLGSFRGTAFGILVFMTAPHMPQDVPCPLT